MPTTTLASRLFQPFELKGLRLPNRVVMAPMTRGKSPGGIPGEDVAEYYAKRARGGTGLIITEGTFIDDRAAGIHWYPAVPHLYGQKALDGWRQVVTQVHAAGGLIFPQLWHLGMSPLNGKNPSGQDAIGPSGLAFDGTAPGEPLTVKRIETLLEGYVRSAVNAKECGFDGLELHGAHGYLLDQFFWSQTNKRTDKYGGPTIAQRATFVAELVRAIKAAVGQDYPLSLRVSQWKLNAFDFKNATTPEELDSWLSPLSEAGVDIFHCSTRRFWLPEFEGSNLNLAGWAKKLTGKPTITVGSVSLNEDFIHTFARDTNNDQIDFHDLEARLENNEFDLVAVGRALLSNPDWANLLRENKIDKMKPFRREELQYLK